jgi:undecaprenyl-diphosphatase
MNLQLALASIIEGITEFLPISSTAHLIIFSKLTHVDLTSEYVKFYILFIQLGALLAGLLLFTKRVFASKEVFSNIVISFIPTSIIGLILYKMFKKLLEGNMLILGLMLLIGGLIFIYLEKVFLKNTDNQRKQKEHMTKMDAFVIGLAQAVAIVPGVSRSGATIIAGMFRNIKKAVIVEYTFILALPTLGAAVLYDAYKSREVFKMVYSYNELFFGFVLAFVSGFATLYVLKKYLPKISLTFFGYYRIVLAIIVFFVLYK